MDLSTTNRPSFVNASHCSPPLPDFYLASHPNGLYILCQGGQPGSNSVLYLYNPAKPKPFAKPKDLSRAYMGIAARPNGLLLTVFVTSKFGRGEICYYDFGTQGEDPIPTGDGAIDTQNPKGIVALSMR
jgi:hypothetical protein